jgi:hypothetical protein
MIVVKISYVFFGSVLTHDLLSTNLYLLIYCWVIYIFLVFRTFLAIS